MQHGSPFPNDSYLHQPAKSDPELFHAIAKKNARRVNELLAAGERTGLRGQYGLTALHWAAFYGDPLITKILVQDYCAEVNAISQGGDGITPLDLACLNPFYRQTIKILESHGGLPVVAISAAEIQRQKNEFLKRKHRKATAQSPSSQNMSVNSGAGIPRSSLATQFSPALNQSHVISGATPQNALPAQPFPVPSHSVVSSSTVTVHSLDEKGLRLTFHSPLDRPPEQIVFNGKLWFLSEYPFSMNTPPAEFSSPTAGIPMTPTAVSNVENKRIEPPISVTHPRPTPQYAKNRYATSIGQRPAQPPSTPASSTSSENDINRRLLNLKRNQANENLTAGSAFQARAPQVSNHNLRIASP